jgi:hypothetical protein
MNFYRADRYGAERVVNRVAVMGIGSGVDDDAVTASGGGLLDGVDDRALAVILTDVGFQA